MTSFLKMGVERILETLCMWNVPQTLDNAQHNIGVMTTSHVEMVLDPPHKILYTRHALNIWQCNPIICKVVELIWCLCHSPWTSPTYHTDVLGNCNAIMLFLLLLWLQIGLLYWPQTMYIMIDPWRQLAEWWVMGGNQSTWKETIALSLSQTWITHELKHLQWGAGD